MMKRERLSPPVSSSATIQTRQALRAPPEQRPSCDNKRSTEYIRASNADSSHLSNVHLNELNAIWASNPEVPSVVSRRAWAEARNIDPAKVHTWFSRRKCNTLAKGGQVFEGSYELPVDAPKELLSAGKERLDKPKGVKRERAVSPALRLPVKKKRQKIGLESTRVHAQADMELHLLRSVDTNAINESQPLPVCHIRAHNANPHPSGFSCSQIYQASLTKPSNITSMSPLSSRMHTPDLAFSSALPSSEFDVDELALWEPSLSYSAVEAPVQPYSSPGGANLVPIVSRRVPMPLPTQKSIEQGAYMRHLSNMDSQNGAYMNSSRSSIIPPDQKRKCATFETESAYSAGSSTSIPNPAGFSSSLNASDCAGVVPAWYTNRVNPAFQMNAISDTTTVSRLYSHTNVSSSGSVASSRLIDILPASSPGLTPNPPASALPHTAILPPVAFMHSPALAATHSHAYAPWHLTLPGASHCYMATDGSAGSIRSASSCAFTATDSSALSFPSMHPLNFSATTVPVSMSIPASALKVGIADTTTMITTAGVPELVSTSSASSRALDQTWISAPKFPARLPHYPNQGSKMPDDLPYTASPSAQGNDTEPPEEAKKPTDTRLGSQVKIEGVKAKVARRKPKEKKKEKDGVAGWERGPKHDLGEDNVTMTETKARPLLKGKVSDFRLAKPSDIVAYDLETSRKPKFQSLGALRNVWQMYTARICRYM